MKNGYGLREEVRCKLRTPLSTWLDARLSCDAVRCEDGPARASLLAVAALVAVLSGCFEEDPFAQPDGTFGGQVVISGPLRGAKVSIDQINRDTGAVRAHVTDTTTDDDGRFSVKVSVYNGLLRATTSGGSFVDVASGTTIQLDASDQLTSLVWFDLLENSDDILISPIGHLVDARAQWALQKHGDITVGANDAIAHLHRHFGNVNWERMRLVGLDQPVTSPTEAVRAALVQTSLSYLAKDIADQAGASSQEVNVYSLTQRWAEDLRADGIFDGNDRNEDDHGSGLQIGVCPPLTRPCDPSATCGCRPLCDLYVGTPRALLGAVMTKVIRNPDVNMTGLNVNDTLAIARALSDNTDPDIFGDACIETLDRIPPLVSFLTPNEAALVRGTLTVKASAVDDTDPNPVARIVGHPDTDGDPTNASAQAAIDTTAVPDGELEIVAAARDMAGNEAMSSRTVTVDNTAPMLTLASTGFFIDGSTWWTASGTPALQGTVMDTTSVTIKAVVAGGVEITGTVNGTSWSLTIPAGGLDPNGTQVTLVATDAVGNQTSVVQRLRPDLSPPALSFQPSTVNNEATETATFPIGGDDSPHHAHTGPAIDLTTSGSCPTLTKFSYLLSSTAPAYAVESPGRNPIVYQLVAADDGVGISAGSIQYRVGRRVGGSTQWLLSWTTTGAGVPVSPGTTRYPVGIYSDLVAGLATTPGTYDVEFRATDRLTRTTTVARCFDLSLKAPPLHFGTGGPTASHTFALDALSLAAGAPFDLISQRLLNNDATGASLIDQPFTNGTSETIYLTVTVTRRPIEVKATRTFRLRQAVTARTAVNLNCVEGSPGCELPPTGDSYQTPLPQAPVSSTTLHFPVKVYEVIAGAPSVEIPCIAPCAPTDVSFKFAIPPRPLGQPARSFIAMTTIAQVRGLWPEDSMRPAAPPFLDTEVAGTRITGLVNPGIEACSKFISYTDPDTMETSVTGCRERATYILYRALTSAQLEFSSDTSSTYSTSPTAQLPGERAAPTTNRFFGIWSTTEGTLP